MKKHKFVIYSPRQQGGGAIVLHLLCKLLNELGYEARIFYMREYPYRKGVINKLKFYVKYFEFTLNDFYLLVKSKLSTSNKIEFKGYKNVTVKGCKRKLLPFVDRNSIVVYPEKEYGNPLRASKVVRWLLYYYDYFGDRHAYSDSDVFVSYRDMFDDPRLNPNKIKLYIFRIDMGLYKQTNFGERSGNCYVLHKGKNREDLPKQFDGPIIDLLSEEEKVKVLNKSKYCISYDTETAYSSIAALCGCISIVMPEKGKSEKDYRKGEDKRYGVAFDFSSEQIEYAQNTVPLLRKQYVDMNNEALNNVKQWVKKIEELI